MLRRRADLVGWWPGEGDALNRTSHPLDGTAQGGVTYAAGKVDRAFAFDGVAGYVEVPDHPALRLTNVLTIEFWAKRQRWGIDLVLEKGGD